MTSQPSQPNPIELFLWKKGFDKTDHPSLHSFQEFHWEVNPWLKHLHHQSKQITFQTFLSQTPEVLEFTNDKIWSSQPNPPTILQLQCVSGLSPLSVPDPQTFYAQIDLHASNPKTISSISQMFFNRGESTLFIIREVKPTSWEAIKIQQVKTSSFVQTTSSDD